MFRLSDRGCFWLPLGLAALFWLLVLTGIILWATSAKAATIFDNHSDTEWSNPGVFHGCGSPNTYSYLQFDYSSNTQVVISSVQISQMRMTNGAATSGQATLTIETPAGLNLGIPTFPLFDFSTSVDNSATFGFSPPINLYADNVATFTIGDPYSITNCIGGSGFAVYWAYTTSTEEITNAWQRIDGGVDNSYGSLVSPKIIILGQGVDPDHPPDPGTFGLSGTSTNPGDFGLFGSWFTAAIQWLFVPSDQSETDLQDARDDLGTRIPFGWFAQVSSTFGGLGGDSTTSSVFTIYASSTTSTLSAVFFDPTLVESKIPSDIQSFIRLLGGLVLWTGLFLWIVSLITERAPAEDSTL